MLLREGGYATITDPAGQRQEFSTFRCQHCGTQMRARPGQKVEEVVGGCRSCLNVRNPLSGMICMPCVAKGTCTPFEKMLERMERRSEYQRLFECR